MRTRGDTSTPHQLPCAPPPTRTALPHHPRTRGGACFHTNTHPTMRTRGDTSTPHAPPPAHHHPRTRGGAPLRTTPTNRAAHYAHARGGFHTPTSFEITPHHPHPRGGACFHTNTHPPRTPPCAPPHALHSPTPHAHEAGLPCAPLPPTGQPTMRTRGDTSTPHAPPPAPPPTHCTPPPPPHTRRGSLAHHSHQQGRPLCTYAGRLPHPHFV